MGVAVTHGHALVPRLASASRLVVDGAARALVPGLVDLLRTLDDTLVELHAPAHVPLAVITKDRATAVVDKGPRDGAETPHGFSRVEPPVDVGAGQLVAAGSRVLVAASLLARHPRARADLATWLGLVEEHVTPLSTLPGDVEESLDAWLLVLDDTRAVVPEIDDSAFEAVRMAHEVALGRLVQTFLDVRAAELSSMGFAVTRLPAMPPIYLERDAGRPEGWVGTFLTPTQALVVDVRGARLVVLPRFQSEAFPLLYRGVFGRHVARWTSFFESEGYRVVSVDVELLVNDFRPLCRLAMAVPTAA